MMSNCSMVVRLRRLLLSGLSFFSLADLQTHARRICQDPWITGSPVTLTRQERRSSRAPQAPSFPEGWVVSVRF